MRVLLLERGKLIIGRLVDDHMIFDPAHLALAGLGFEEAASMLDYFKRLSVGHQSDAVRYSGNPVSQVGLLRHHVDHLGLGCSRKRVQPLSAVIRATQIAEQKSKRGPARRKSDKAANI